jgi:hypothetical protein
VLTVIENHEEANAPLPKKERESLANRRFQAQELEYRIDILETLHSPSFWGTYTCPADGMSWSEMVTDMKTIHMVADFTAMQVTRLMYFLDCFTTTAGHGGSMYASDDAVAIDHGAKRLLDWFRIPKRWASTTVQFGYTNPSMKQWQLKFRERFTQHLQTKLGAAVAIELTHPKYTEQEKTHEKHKNKGGAELNKAKYTRALLPALRRLLCDRTYTFLEMENIYCEMKRRMVVLGAIAPENRLQTTAHGFDLSEVRVISLDAA